MIRNLSLYYEKFEDGKSVLSIVDESTQDCIFAVNDFEADRLYDYLTKDEKRFESRE